MKTYIFANTQYCWKHYVTYPYCQPVFPISADLFKYKNCWWYIEIVKIHIMVCQQKILATPSLTLCQT